MMSFRHIARFGIPAAVVFLSASCASPGPEPGVERGDTVVVQASSAARLAYERGDFGQAQKLYRRALTRAWAINDAGSAADAAYNLAMSEIGLGDYDEAALLLRQAYYDAVRASSNTAEIQMVRAKVAFLRMQPSQALMFVDEIAASKPSQSIILQATILRGQMFGDAGDEDAAKSELRAAESLVASSQTGHSASVGADVAKLAGTVSRLEGKPAIAAHAFDDEAELLRIAHRYRDMAYALARAAKAYLEAGQQALAADRFFLAARSLEGHGDLAAATTLVSSSLSAANSAADHDAQIRAEVLLEEINRRRAP
jgi:tetratricopeptide (TPR) repeat protein